MSPWIKLDRLHKISIYLIVLIAFSNVASAGGVGIIVSIIFLVGYILSWFRDGRINKQTHPTPPRWPNITIIATLIFSVAGLLLTDTTIVVSGIRFLLILCLIKLFSRFSDRDDLQIYALSFMLFAAATIINDGLSYGLFFGIFVLCGTLSLALFHLRSETRDYKSYTNQSRHIFSRPYIIVLITMSFLIFISSLGIFFLFPRVGLGFFATQSRDPVKVTGFNQNVELGDHGVLRDNPQVVMRVEFPDGRPDSTRQFYWRVMTFDEYDGQIWRRNLDFFRMVRRRSRTSDGYDLSFLYSDTFQRTLNNHPTERIQIYLEPLGSNILPTMWPTTRLSVGESEIPLPRTPRSGRLLYDDYGDLRHTIESQLGVPYQLTRYSEPPREVYTSTVGGQLPDRIKEHYLQLPPLSSDVQHLAQRITARAMSNYQKAEAIRDYFADNFRYSDILPEVSPGRNAVESFLFETQYGHCEYFATAAIILARSVGVPTRLVNGFLGGTWNEVGNYLTVRQGHAHSWIEVFVPEYGWLPLDPTPASESPLNSRNPALRWIDNTYDAMRLTWYKWVIEYDLEAQVRILKDIGKRFQKSDDRFQFNRQTHQQSGDLKENSQTNRALFVFLIPFALAILAYVHGRTIRNRRLYRILSAALWLSVAVISHFMSDSLLMIYAGVLPGIAFGIGLLMQRVRQRKQHIHVASRYLHQIESVGKKHGLARRNDEGAADYLQRIAKKIPQSNTQIQQFKTIYLNSRFGATPLSTRQLHTLQTLYKAIRSAIKQHSK